MNQPRGIDESPGLSDSFSASRGESVPESPDSLLICSRKQGESGFDLGIGLWITQYLPFGALALTYGKSNKAAQNTPSEK